MSRRSRYRRREYTGFREERYRYRSPAGESFIDSSDDLDTLVQSAAPPLASIRRFPEFESDPVPSFSAPDSVSWLEYPPNRATFTQEPRRTAVRTSHGASAASLLRPFFAHPEAVRDCVRRKERREVIFAKTGGGRGMPPRKFKVSSGTSC